MKKNPGTTLTVELKLYEIMQEQGVSVAELAKRTGMSAQGLYYLLNRPPTSIYISTIAKICKALNVDPGTLLKLEEVPNDPRS